MSSLSLLVTMTIVLAAWLVTHVALVIATVRTEALSARERWVSLIPPLTPWIAWRAGRKRAATAWACLIVLYVLLRCVLGAR